MDPTHLLNSSCA